MPRMETKPPFISRVVIENYKSIKKCDVRLGALQFLVGRNGVGKSNFLDALAFVRDALMLNDVGKAIRQWHFDAFHQRPEEAPRAFCIRLEFNLPGDATGHFAFQVEENVAESARSFKVVQEECCIEARGASSAYKTQNGEVQFVKIQSKKLKQFPPLAIDRLYLQSMSVFDEFRYLHDALQEMHFYNPEPMLVASMHDSYPGRMSPDTDIGSILMHLTPKTKERIMEYLKCIFPHFSDFQVEKLRDGDKLLLFGVGPEGAPRSFLAHSMSDGTLRALGILTALLQEQKNGNGNFPALIGIEEPETGLHACAFGALLGAMQEASDMRQVIVATHSADMLDDKEVTPDRILPVEMRGLASVIAPIEGLTKEELEGHLTTAGELLRQDQLKPGDGSESSKIFSLKDESPLFDGQP